MSEPFDPYYRWLGIPPKDQPPHYYRLLGLELFEEERDVIDAAANRVMAYLKDLAPGDDTGQSQRLLNEVAQARLCLLTRDKKAAYDQELRSKLPATRPPPRSAPKPATGPSASESLPPWLATDAPAVPACDVSPLPESPDVWTPMRAKRPAAQRPYLIVGASAVAGLLLVAALVAVWSMMRGGQVAVQSQQPSDVAPGHPAETSPAGPGTQTLRPSGEPRAADSKASPASDAARDAAGDRPPPSGSPTASSAAAPGPPAASSGPAPEVPVAGTQTAPGVGQAPARGASPSVPAPAVSAVEAVASEGPAYVLHFEGPAQFVELVNTNQVASRHQVFTAEMWVRWRLDGGNVTLLGTHAVPTPGRRSFTGWFVHIVVDNGMARLWQNSARSGTQLNPSGVNLDSGGWHHLAFVRNENEALYVCVDGKSTSPGRYNPVEDDASTNLCLGALPHSASTAQFQGEIRGFRLSSTVRYLGDYAPPPTFEKDADTVVLLDFSRPQRGLVEDISGNGHHGMVVGARWMRLAGDQLRAITPPAASIAGMPVAPPSPSAPSAGAAAPELQMPADPLAPAPLTPPENAVPETAPQKSPVPDAAAQAAARQQVRDLYATKLTAAKTFTEKTTLAEELLSLARDTEDDLASRYVLFEEAAKLAAQAPEFEVAMRAIDELEAHFEADGWSLRKGALKEIGTRASTPQNARQFAEAVLEVVDDAIAAEKFDEALEIYKLASGAANRSGSVELRTQFRRRGEQLETLQKQSELAELAQQRLKTEPENAKANLALDKYLCLTRQQWTEGLPYVAKGDDAALKQAAEKDLQAPADSPARGALGDLWWEAAQPAKGVEREALLARAGLWYQQALEGSSGLARVRVEKRIEEIQKEIPGWNPRAAGLAKTGSDASRPSRGDRVAGPLPTAATPGRPVAAPVVVHNPGAGAAVGPSLPPTVVLPAIDRAEALAISPDGGLLAAGIRAGTIVLWDLRTGREARRMAGHTAQVACLAFSPDGKMLASGSHDGSVKVWDPASGQELRTHRGSQAQAWMQQVAFSRDGKLFAFSGYTQSTALCEAKTGNVRHQLEGFTSALAFAPDSKTLATARQKIVLYDVDTGQQKLSLERHGSEIKCLAFSPDGRILASASDDGSVRLSDAANGAEKLVIIDSAPFRSLGFSSDGTRLWFGAGSRIKVLDSTTGQTALVLGGDARDYLSATAATPDGGLLAGAWGRAIPVWDLRPRRRR